MPARGTRPRAEEYGLAQPPLAMVRLRLAPPSEMRVPFSAMWAVTQISDTLASAAAVASCSGVVTFAVREAAGRGAGGGGRSGEPAPGVTLKLAVSEDGRELTVNENGSGGRPGLSVSEGEARRNGMS